MSLSPAPKSEHEVRRCECCGQAALTCVHAWQHRVIGITTGTVTGDYRCQACGHKVILRPTVEIRVRRVFGCIFLPAIFPGIYFLLQARRWSRAWTDNPVVPDAPFPEIRWRDQPRDRRCARCGKHAVIRKIRKRRINGISTGLTYEFQCQGCETEFTTQNPQAIFTHLFGVVVVSGIAAAIFSFAKSAASRYGWGGAFSLVALLGLWMVVSRIRAAIQNPEIREY